VHQTNILHDETDFGNQTQDPMGNDMEDMIGTFGFMNIHEERESHFQNHRRPTLCRSLDCLVEDQSRWENGNYFRI